MASRPQTIRPLAAEFLGTLILLATVVGSGIMAERLRTETSRSPCLPMRWPRCGAGGADHIFARFRRAFQSCVTLYFALRKDIAWSGIAYAVIQVMAASPAYGWPMHVRAR